MKISFDIECTPAEARAFLGLPDLAPVHQIYLDKLTNVVTDGVGPADVERMMRLWLPGMSESVESWRQALFTAGRSKDA